MPLYIGDYLADTMRLTTEQHGAYLLLLMQYWRCGCLPDDDGELSAITKLPIDSWVKMRPKLARFFSVEGGFWTQKRVEKERAAAESRRLSAQENGKKGGRPRGAKKPTKNPEANPQKTRSFSGGEPTANPDGNPQKSSSPSPSPKRTPLPDRNGSGVEDSLGGELKWGAAE